jgi:hypothetical protein
VKQRLIIAALVAWAALAFAGAAEARITGSSPPAPRRTAASPRHSAAGASATATQSVKTRHGRTHRRGLRRSDRTGQITARPSGATPGGSPPLPARRPASRHNAALSPPLHVLRQLARTRAGSPGLAVESPSCIAVFTAMSRLYSNPVPPPISQDDPVTSGRGPPRASPHRDTLSPWPIAISGFRRTSNSLASQPDQNRSGILSSFAARNVPAARTGSFHFWIGSIADPSSTARRARWRASIRPPQEVLS